MGLQARLDAFKADFEAGRPPYNVQPWMIEILHRATDELRASGQAEYAKRVGDRAPAFSLTDTEGRGVSSQELLATGPLVVSFYRGVWCPYCNLELQALQEVLPSLEARGATLVAISPQTVANNRKSARDTKLTFPVLSDAKGDVGAAFGLRYSLPDYLIELYKSLKIDLASFNDDSSWTLSMPARYVIGQDGAILYAEVNPDYTRRPEPEEMLPILENISKVSG